MNKDDEYIPIDSILEIQNNLRVDLLNKRYIDKDGNRFVVRFGKESRKPEILRVQARSDLKTELNSKSITSSKQPITDHEAASVSDRFSNHSLQPKSKEQIRSENKADLEPMTTQEDTSDMLVDIDLNIENTDSSTKSAFDNSLVNPMAIQDERRYIFDLLKCFDKDKERILSTLANVKNSRIFELTGDPSENKNIISNFTREFEMEVFQILDNLQNKFKEIVSFPKTINHYSMGYSLAQKDFLTALDNDKMRLDYILRWEMQEPSLLLVKKFAKMVVSLLSVLNTKEEEQIKSLSFQQQTLFRDTKTAALYCLNDLDFLKRSLENWIKSTG